MDITGIQTPAMPQGKFSHVANNAVETDFAAVLREAVEAVNRQVQDADTAQRDFAVGRAQSVHDVMIAMEKADISLRLLTQMRNKAVEAYQEIMRMQL
jgi:flagellar hook-basal body complex protein FliE